MFKKKPEVVNGVVLRIGLAVRGGDQAAVLHVVALENQEALLTLAVDDGDFAKWRMLSSSLAVVAPGDSISFEGVLNDNDIFVIEKLWNHSFPA